MATTGRLPVQDEQPVPREDRTISDSLMKGLRQAALYGAVSLYGVYAFILTWAEHGVGCRAGGEGLLPTIFIGMPVIGVAMLSVWLLRASVELTTIHRWLVLGGLGVATLVTIPQLLIVSALGHHPCGPRYDAFLGFVEVWDRWIPVTNVVLIALAALVALGPWVRKLDEGTVSDAEPALSAESAGS